MKYLAGVASLSLFVLSVTAGSTLMLCSDADLAGECVFIDYKNNKCHNMPGYMNDKVSSVAPAGDGHQCTLYRDYNCQGPTFQANAYISFLAAFNDELSSFKCSS